MDSDDLKKIIGIKIFLETKSRRLFVGMLTHSDELFHFEYDKKYLKMRAAIPLGPEMPLTKRKYQSDQLFIPFVDRIPSKENPAYEEYCRATGIKVSETDPFILLSTIAHRGPSSFIFEPLYEDIFTSEDMFHFRKSLGFSVREFADCFDFSPAAITRVETQQSSGREVLKRAELYARYPEIARDQLKLRGGGVHYKKLLKAENWIKKQLEKS